MPEERTKEQRDAEAELEDAIARVYRSYGGTFLPTQWVVCLAVQGADAESDFSEVVPIMQTGMQQYQLIGLLRMATLRVEADPGEEIDS